MIVSRHCQSGTARTMRPLIVAFLVAASLLPIADANALTRCEAAARAYAARQLGSARPLAILTRCIRDDLERRGQSGDQNKKSDRVVNQGECRKYAGRYFNSAGSLSIDDLMYLDACLKAVKKYFRD